MTVFDQLRPIPPPAGTPDRTPEGRPWVSWVKKDGYQGWRAGTRPVTSDGRFWDSVLSIAGAYFGTHADDVHCLGDGILSVGVLGVTLESGYAERLLQQCLLTDPIRFVNVMAPILATGARMKPSDKRASGVALAGPEGRPLLLPAELRALVLLGSDSATWTNAQKSRARLWVSSVSELLRDTSMDRAQRDFASEILPGLLPKKIQHALRWPGHTEDTWMYTKELQAAWAFAMVLVAAGDSAVDLLDAVLEEVPTTMTDGELLGRMEVSGSWLMKITREAFGLGGGT